MRKTSVRIWITAGVVVIAFGIIGYTLLFPRSETPQQKEFQTTAAPQNSDRGAEQVGQSQAVKTAQVEAPKSKKVEKAAPTEESAQTGAGSHSDVEEKLLAAGRSALSNPSGRVRAMAAARLRRAKSEEAVDLLTEFLDDENKMVIFHALSSLSIMGIKNSHLEDKVYNILLEKAKDKECPVRDSALIFASEVGKDDKVLDVISDYINEHDEDESGKRIASKALAALASPESIGHLQKLLETSKSHDIHDSALNTLSMIDDEAAATILEEKLLTTSTQNSATMALAQWGKSEYNQILSKAMKNGNLDKEAITIVAQSPAGPVLLEDFLKNNTFSNEETLSLLKIYSETVPKASYEVRLDAAKAVEPLLEDPDSELQIEAIRILGSGTWEQRDMADMLAPKLQSPEKEIRLEALKAYRGYLVPEDYKTVLAMIWDEDETIRRNALVAAELFIDGSDRPLLEEALNHEDEVIRNRVEQILN